MKNKYIIWALLAAVVLYAYWHHKKAQEIAATDTTTDAGDTTQTDEGAYTMGGAGGGGGEPAAPIVPGVTTTPVTPNVTVAPALVPTIVIQPPRQSALSSSISARPLSVSPTGGVTLSVPTTSHLPIGAVVPTGLRTFNVGLVGIHTNTPASPTTRNPINKISL